MLPASTERERGEQCMVTVQTRGSSKLTTKKRKELILGLCRAFAALRSAQEVADALTDLLTPKEVETVAKRLYIAERLVQGDEYRVIRDDVRVGFSTIARVNTWLNLSGEGFRVMLTRRKKSPRDITDEERYDPYSWHNIKRRYSMYFWPQLLLEELIRNSDKKEKEKIHEIYEKLQLKRHRFNAEENKRLYETFSSEFGRSKKRGPVT